MPVARTRIIARPEDRVDIVADGFDLGGARLLPGLVNAHDHLDLAPFPPLGRPPYANLYDWTRDAEGEASECRELMALAPVERLFLGGLRNLLAGVSAVAHHGPFHRSLARPDFPVRVQDRYQFAHSPGLTPAAVPTLARACSR